MVRSANKQTARTGKHTAPALEPRPADDVLTIEVGWQGDGGVYLLGLRSQERIREAFPDARIISDMLIAYDKKRDYERYHRPYWEQIARMLTGLTDEQIARLGGIRIYEVYPNKVIWEWKPTPVTR